MGIFSINKVTLVGKLGKDPEYRTTTGGTEVVKFSMATEHSVKKNDDWENVTTWHNVVFFGIPDFQKKILRKGVAVHVEGRVSNRSYEKDGEKKYFSEVVGDKRNFIVFDKSDSSESNSRSTEPAPPQADDDDLPF